MERSTGQLMIEEARLWEELRRLIGALPEQQASEPGYFEEGWSAKDLVGHIGAWLAEAGVVLERIRFGTHRPEEIDIDTANAAFLAAMRDATLADVQAQAIAARERMLRAWGALPEASAEADRWIDKTGPAHYQEHLPRLRQWVEELSA
jgi:Mycothiol maleylpyruvate isomerase N-terminal domain